MADPIASYPEGTPVNDIAGFDRGQKVSFRCTRHPELGHWVSKDPFSSRWFGEHIGCNCPWQYYVTASPYNPTRFD